MPPPQKTWLITGANRGIGRALVDALAPRPNQTIIASVRSISKAGQELQEFAKTLSNGSKIIVVEFEATEEAQVQAAAARLHGRIPCIDIIIANAGIASSFQSVLETPAEDMVRHYHVNAVAPVVLFQQFYSLLSKSQDPKYVYISTLAASITSPLPLPSIAYPPTKLAGNMVTRRIHTEHESVTAFALAPGGVDTDMGRFALKAFGLLDENGKLATNTPFQSISPRESAEKMLVKIDAATRETSGGKFHNYEGDDIPW